MSTNEQSTYLLTAAEAASTLRVSRQSIYRAIASGRLEAYRVGRDGPLRIPAHALVEHLRRAAPAAERGTSVALPPGGDDAAWRQGQSLQGQP